MSTKKQITELLKIIQNDCQAQVDTLKARNDVDWSCYDVGNWESMVDTLKMAAKLLREVKETKPTKAYVVFEHNDGYGDSTFMEVFSTKKKANEYIKKKKLDFRMVDSDGYVYTTGNEISYEIKDRELL